MTLLAFASLTKAKALKLVAGFEAAARINVSHLAFVGAWQGRKFVVKNMLEAKFNVGEAFHDRDTLTLTLPTTMTNWSEIMREFSRFGATVASNFRKKKFFEFVEDNAGVVHICHGFHHIAVCGGDGPWLEAATDTVWVTCSACAKAASQTKSYRARYHPNVDEFG